MSKEEERLKEMVALLEGELKTRGRKYLLKGLYMPDSQGHL